MTHKPTWYTNESITYSTPKHKYTTHDSGTQYKATPLTANNQSKMKQLQKDTLQQLSKRDNKQNLKEEVTAINQEKKSIRIELD